MKRFGGKFYFVIDDRKLVFWEYRLGLISKDRTEIRDKNGRMVPLPPEACEFFAINMGDGTYVLQTSNGEVMCVNHGGSVLIASTWPTRIPFFQIPMDILRFDLAELRKFKTEVTGVRLRCYRDGDPQKNWFDLTWRRGVEREVDKIWGARHLSNLDSQATTADRWRLRQLGDGVDELQAAKKATYRNFTPSGLAIVDLSGEDLTGVDFGDADFTRAVLTGAVLKNTTHDGSTFSYAQLDGANFEGAALKKVNFSDASMRGTTLKRVTGASCNFSRCDLLSVVIDAPLAIESPEGARTRFSYAHMNYALLGSNWVRKELDWATILNFPPDAYIDAQKANLTGITLAGVTIAAASKFDEAILRGASLHASTIAYCSFKGAYLDGTKSPEFAAADFAAAQLQGSVFDDAHCSGTNFSGARLDEAKFEKATLIGANFANAYLREVSFAAVEQQAMRGAIFNRAFLVNANFSGTDLSTYDGVAVNMTQAYLHGANFTGAKLSGTLMAGAGLSFDRGEIEVKLGDSSIQVEYEPSEIDPRTTTRETTCPSGSKGPGPCSESDMHTRQPFPTSWPWPHGRRNERATDEEE